MNVLHLKRENVFLSFFLFFTIFFSIFFFFSIDSPEVLDALNISGSFQR